MWRLALLLVAALLPAVAEARDVLPLERGWRFYLGDIQGAEAPGFDDGRWSRVDLPHTWNRLGSYTVTRSTETRSEQGVGWYRLMIDTAPLRAGARHFLEFDGVGNIAELWVNGRRIGRHDGAFSRFRFDVTDALAGVDRAVVAVRADNTRPAPGSSTAHIIPLDGDFFVHGGLYRGVRLVSVAAQHFDLLDYGGPGVYARTTRIGARGADIAVLARLRNMAAARRLVLAFTIRAADGRTVAQSSEPVPLTAGRQEVSTQLTLPNPRLWNGRADPYRYVLVAELRDGDTLVDRVEQPLGIRTMRFDADKGFFLNGRHLPLHGVSRHQDWLGKGWALTAEDHERDMALIAEMGANTVRFAHYQHAPEWFELADRAGMVVWAELAFVGQVAFDDSPASPALVANARQQLIEQVRQNYNYASIAMWGIGNEVDIHLALMRRGPKADPLPLLRELNALSKLEDPARATVIADCCEATPGDKAPYQRLLTDAADLMGYNRYFGWYYGGPLDLGAHLDALHKRHPRTPISVSEFGAGGATSQHSDNPEGGAIQSGGRPHPEDFQALWHELSWPQLADRRYLFGNWIWNMFDFSSNIRQEGDATDINDKGLVTFDRKVKKDAFHYYKAHWSAEPVVHITGRRYVDRSYPVADIRVYSNADAVRLDLNGRDLGVVPCVDRVCVLRDVSLAEGTNRVAATATIDGRRMEDTVEWRAPAAADGLTINVGDLTNFSEGGRRTGSDNWFDGGTPKRLADADRQRASGADPRLLQTWREGNFRYAIPLPDGRWQVTLTFMEPDPQRTKPRFIDVSSGGEFKLSGFDPARAAGGPLKAVDRSFEAEVRDGRLRFSVAGDDVALFAIAARPLSGSRPVPAESQDRPASRP